VALCQEWGIAEVIALSHIELAYIHQALGNDDQARMALQEAKRVFEEFSPWGAGTVAAHQARFDLARGPVQAAERWSNTIDLNVDGEFALHREIEYLTLAR
ncbi:MAG: hypothetical protein GTO41_03900, partial [Burkholderiales bacterium]|nr:hypothetical protein [Burkholderiales bacterium]